MFVIKCMGVCNFSLSEDDAPFLISETTNLKLLSVSYIPISHFSYSSGIENLFAIVNNSNSISASDSRLF